jgi:hypothetical protein
VAAARESLPRTGWQRAARGRITLPTPTIHDYPVASELALLRFALSHVHAGRDFTVHPSEIRRTPSTLAVPNRTIASPTALAWSRPSIAREELVALRRCYRGLYSSRGAASEMAWAKPCVATMVAPMQDVHVA